MNLLRFAVLIVAIAVLAPLPAYAQRGLQSPHETVSAVIDGNRVTLTYGRPYTKERKVWGTLVPYGKAWRLGADEATLLVTQQPLAIGETTIAPGAYTLYMVPEENGGKLAFSTGLGGWGIPVDEKHDLARVDLKREAYSTPNDQLALAIERNTAGGGVIKIMWEGAQYSVPFTIKK